MGGGGGGRVVMGRKQMSLEVITWKLEVDTLGWDAILKQSLLL